jgi:hypothetical protein
MLTAEAVERSVAERWMVEVWWVGERKLWSVMRRVKRVAKVLATMGKMSLAYWPLRGKIYGVVLVGFCDLVGLLSGGGLTALTVLSTMMVVMRVVR